MQPSARQKELEALYEKRRKGHVPQISITDDDHHVTEAIGSYYDDEPVSKTAPNTRPLSFIAGPEETYESKEQRRSKRNGSYFEQRVPLAASAAKERLPLATEAPNGSLKRRNSLGTEVGIGGGSTPGGPSQLSRQSSTDTAVSQFPLNDIDYESSAAAVAQELSNLQAIRRMSMNVDTADPDLPSFGGAFNGVPTADPKTSEDETDAARLFWVPARLHPELAPKEFKTFLEERVEKIKRRSGDADTLSAEGFDQSGSGDGLRRKKSMLSRQIDAHDNYEDGAERLERKRSKGMRMEGHAHVDLAELETLVNDPAQLIRRLSIDHARRSLESGSDASPGEDMPILLPGGQSLKRSTRTAYRRGSLRKGERMPFSKRAQQRQIGSEADEHQMPASPTIPAIEEPLAESEMVQTEPSAFNPSIISAPSSAAKVGSPREDVRIEPRRPSAESSSESAEVITGPRSSPPLAQDGNQASPWPQNRRFHSRLVSGQGRTTAQLPGYDNQNPLPQIVETLPDGTKVPRANIIQNIPERRSSHELPRGFHRAGAHMRPAISREQRSATLDDISQRPSPLPGSGNTSTDALTMVPTFDDRKTERRDSTKKSGWKWIRGSDEDRKPKEDKSVDSAGIASVKGGKLGRAGGDKVRLDLLQSSIDGNSPSKGRESLVLSRDDVRIDDDRKKDGKRSSDSKKERERESGLLSAIFGSKKKASDGDLKDRRRKFDRNVSPEPQQRAMKADIDYNWTRFSILEERAIYRMAHIKLANPRRALYSQVLLSNFMYSYLAKVQMMHPQVQIPIAHQKSQQRGQQEQQPVEYSQYQRWQQQQEREAAAAAAENSASALNEGTSADMTSGGAVQPRGTFEYDDESPASYDARSPEEYGYDQLYPSTQAAVGPQKANGAAAPSGSRGSLGGGGYSVAQTHDYLGYPKDQQPFDSHGLWDDEDKTEELW